MIQRAEVGDAAVGKTRDDIMLMSTPAFDANDAGAFWTVLEGAFRLGIHIDVLVLQQIFQ
jgi:hypothetical protein